MGAWAATSPRQNRRSTEPVRAGPSRPGGGGAGPARPDAGEGRLPPGGAGARDPSRQGARKTQGVGLVGGPHAAARGDRPAAAGPDGRDPPLAAVERDAYTL